MGLLAASTSADIIAGQERFLAGLQDLIGRIATVEVQDRLANAPAFEPSLRHLEDYVRSQLGSLAAQVNRDAERIRQLEAAVASLLTGRQVLVTEGAADADAASA